MENPCDITEQEFLCQARKLLPEGPLLEGQAEKFLDLTDAIAATHYDLWQDICSLFREAVPCTADETLAEWASMFAFSCDQFPDDPDELREILCDLLSNGRTLNFETVQRLADIDGMTVLSIGWDKTLSTTEAKVPVQGFKVGPTMVGYRPGAQGTTSTPVDDVSDQPCTEKCADPNPDEPLDISHLIVCPEKSAGTIRPNCVPNGAGVGSLCCPEGGVGYRAGAAYLPSGVTLYEPEKPHALIVTVARSTIPPEIACCQPRGQSIMNASAQMGYPLTPPPLEICGLTELVPAYVTIEYVIDCDE